MHDPSHYIIPDDAPKLVEILCCLDEALILGCVKLFLICGAVQLPLLIPLSHVGINGQPRKAKEEVDFSNTSHNREMLDGPVDTLLLASMGLALICTSGT